MPKLGVSIDYFKIWYNLMWVFPPPSLSKIKSYQNLADVNANLSIPVTFPYTIIWSRVAGMSLFYFILFI